MKAKTPRAPARKTAARSEPLPDRGAFAREQLIAHGARIFATKGYAAASTREICQAAGANVAAIHYYFGDKEGLYRAILTEPINAIAGQFGAFADPSLTFAEAIRRVLQPFVAMALDEEAHSPHVQRLHLREALEPSAVFREIVTQVIVPQHDALAGLLARHCGLAHPDAGIHQLAFALIAMANDYCMSREFMKMLAPEVLARDDAVRRIVDHLVGYSGALLDHEMALRRATTPTQPKSRRATRAQRPGTPERAP
jgi:AcrR family transcriptional regulator